MNKATMERRRFAAVIAALPFAALSARTQDVATIARLAVDLGDATLRHLEETPFESAHEKKATDTRLQQPE